ncbi:MAG: arginine--tRNA ligase [Candidatus Aenigmatarchaeota archaeon]
MRKVSEEIGKLLNLPGVEITLETPPEPEFGDIATTACFSLAKQERKPPAKIAESIVNNTKIPKNSLIERMEAKAGYINFFFNRANLAKMIVSESMKKGYGKPKPSRKSVIVEHTSVNPNKALHVGHIRNSCLGDSIANILSFCGNKVSRVNYIDDSGAQVADIIVGFRFLGIQQETKMKFDQYCGNEVYVKVNKLYESDQKLQEERQHVIRNIEAGNNELSDFAEKTVERILAAQLVTLQRMGIGFDLLVKETSVLRAKLWDSAFEKLRASGFVYKEAGGKNAGCWVLKLSDRPEFSKLENADKILARSDGTVLYTGKDIAYAMWKHGMVKDMFGYRKFGKAWETGAYRKTKHPKFGSVDRSINIIDVRQSYAQDVVAAALEMLAPGKADYTHYDYGVVALSRNTMQQLGIAVEDGNIFHMSGRKGVFINVDDVLDILENKAYEETRKRNLGADESWLRSTASKIARSALRYEMTKIDRENTITFDMEESLRLDGNTASYLQYTHARSMKILEKAGKMPKLSLPETITDTEFEIIKAVMSFPDMIEKSCSSISPQEVCRYAYSLCTLFNRFYHDSPVLRAEGATKDFRLNLVKSFLAISEKCLDLVGIDALDKM